MRTAILLLALLAAAPVDAQTDILATRYGVAASASYIHAAVRASSGSQTTGIGGLAIDAVVGRFTVGVAGAFAGESTSLAVGAGYHIVRDLEALRTMTLGVAVQTVDLTDAFLATPSITVTERAAQIGGVAVVPSGTVGFAVPFNLGGGSGATPEIVTAAGVSFFVGQGPTRLSVRPQVTWSPAGDAPAALGIGVGLARGWE